MASVDHKERKEQEKQPQPMEVDSSPKKMIDGGVENGLQEDEPMSDIDGPGFEEAQKVYAMRGRKRARELDSAEAMKRKVRGNRRSKDRFIVSALTKMYLFPHLCRNDEMNISTI